MPHVLWTYRTTPRRSTGETPFSMTYGAEAVIPLETNFPTLRTSTFCPDANNGLLEKSLDLIEERRERAMIQLAYYQHKLKQGYDAKVKLTTVQFHLDVKQNPSPAWLLGPQAWGKLTTTRFYLSVK